MDKDAGGSMYQEKKSMKQLNVNVTRKEDVYRGDRCEHMHKQNKQCVRYTGKYKVCWKWERCEFIQEDEEPKKEIDTRSEREKVGKECNGSSYRR